MSTTTSRISPLVRPLATGLAAASTAASASAAIIYNDTPLSFASGPDSNISVPFSLDGGDADFSGNLYTGKNNTTFAITIPSSFSINSMNGNQVTTGELNFGDFVNGSSSFTGSFAVPIDGASHFLGFVLNPGSSPLYGWMSVIHIGGNGDGNGKVTAWAYDDTGAGIAAGTVPEPASAAAVAALLAGSAAVWKRRRQKVGVATTAA